MGDILRNKVVFEVYPKFLILERKYSKKCYFHYFMALKHNQWFQTLLEYLGEVGKYSNNISYRGYIHGFFTNWIIISSEKLKRFFLPTSNRKISKYHISSSSNERQTPRLRSFIWKAFTNENCVIFGKFYIPSWA